MFTKLRLPLAVVAVIALIAYTPLTFRESYRINPTAAQNAGVCAPAPPTVSRRIAIMGDSLSTTYGATAPEKSWPVMVKTQFATHGWVVDLHGIGSTTASRYLPGQDLFYVTEQVRNSDPDVVVLNFRANEQLQGQTPAQLKTNLLALIDQIRATPASADAQILLWNPPLMWYHGFTSPAAQEAYIAKMWEVKTEKNTCWVDFRPWFPKTGPDTFSRSLLFDDIHYNDQAHPIIAAGISGGLLATCP